MCIIISCFCSPPYRSPNDSPSHCYDIPFPIEDDKTKNGGLEGHHTSAEPAGASQQPQGETAAGSNGAAAAGGVTTTAAPSTTTAAAATTSSRMSKSFTTTFSDAIQSSNSPSNTDLLHHHHHHHHHHNEPPPPPSPLHINNIGAHLCKNSSLDDSLGGGSNGYHKQGVPQSFSMHDFDDRSFQQRHPYASTEIDKEDLKRLMGAASFGYGLFQLSVSLLPPNLLKLISFFGFEGDRRIGIACLKHSRQSEDMRAPLAT